MDIQSNVQATVSGTLVMNAKHVMENVSLSLYSVTL